MVNSPAVTIGMGVRNGEKFLQYTLNNIFLNNYPEDKLEVMICNHGSEDESEAIILEYQQKYQNIKLINIPYEGVNRSLPRNNVLKNASGEIIILIDQDILVSENFISEHVKIHQQFPSCLITGYTFGKISLTDNNVYIEEQGIYLENITNSYQKLKSAQNYKDSREKMEYIHTGSDKDYISVPPDQLPFRIFWTNNISFKREDLAEVGLFDEKYIEWGVEDNDFAYRFQLLNRSMFFSNTAWCYHMVHPVNTKNNYISWKKNLNYFFNKFSNYELEIYFTFGQSKYQKIRDEIKTCLKDLTDNLAYNKIIKELKPCFTDFKEKRLGFFVLNAEVAAELHLSDCFLPLNDKYLQHKNHNSCEFWSLVGFKTPFDDKYFNETIVILDTLIFLDSYMAMLLLLEAARISKKIIFCQSDLYRNDNSYEKEYLERMLPIIGFNEVEEMFA